ncbi:hypothetical protein [Anoxynatronum sibiricum]|uniref:Dihydroorotase n=1 Tax=Anoxynatronum sibiricum TaxID=210623 RepID=A0ABU9VT34_9CLOT
MRTVINQGTLIDPGNGIHQPCHLAIEKGKVAAIAGLAPMIRLSIWMR